ncbi:RNA polymerase sigma-70 factor (ECF subfamily) [Myceligenerans xiligouense]|uniref:RNA polymerase sigma-70 factor (ECF subfamily) n=2 Tax=Myceligenerans xiligouense TaxID=253184 RepID=A0A3N4YIH3_9MICO|nr:RNA polymerase sigma-70 factor (ECF subfamily) [Myceligenerans xiligouense]
MRHADPHDAQEVVADTFLVAVRRVDDIPVDPLPWLLVVARNVLRNQQRAARRRRSAESALERLARVARTDGADEAVAQRDAMLVALNNLEPKEREALLLTGWDGLAPADAARVAGCGKAAFKMRLSRARRKLTALVGGHTTVREAGIAEDGPRNNRTAARRTR